MAGFVDRWDDSICPGARWLVIEPGVGGLVLMTTRSHYIVDELFVRPFYGWCCDSGDSEAEVVALGNFSV